MNGPFQIAQANIAGQSGGKQPARIVKIAKPFSEQAVVVPLSYDGSVKADLSAIAGEKITLVHIGEKLIILFDNKSTITLEPFFDSTGKPLDGIQVEVSPGRDLSSAEFAQLFPVTEDNSILPAAGEGSAGGATASGAHFTTVGVDPLSAPNPLDLLGQEELPNFVITNLLGPLQVDDTPTFDAGQSFLLDEDSLTKPPALRDGNHDSALGDDEGGQSFSGSLHYNFRFDGSASTDPITVNVGALNALGLTSGHQPITFTWDAITFTLTGTADDGQGHQTTILKLQIDPATATSAGNDHPFTLQLLGPIDHPGHDDPSTPAAETSFEDNIVLNVQFTITDGNGTATPGTIAIDIDDDSPAIVSDAIVIRTVDEDDILTPWSIGTSPNTSPEGAGDESVTQGGGGLVHPAVVTGSVAGVVSFGADGEGAFGFTADAVDYFTSLGLYSKQTALPENGIQLTYTVTEDAANHTITLHGVEPGNTGNPVFDFVLDTQTGDFTFKLYDELVHVAGGGQNTDLRAGDSSIPYLDFGHIITATDGDGDTITLDDQLHIIVKDDVPETRISVNPLGVVQHDETAGVQGPTFADPADSDTASPTVRNLFATFETDHASKIGNDTDVAHFPGSPAIGYAHSALPVVVNSTINYGADFPAASAVFSLEVADGTYSGVQTTDGHNIYLYNVDGFIVGRVGGTDAGHDDANPDGTIAFAITIEQSGNIDVAQYLSLHHSNTSSNDESISLTDGAIQAKLVVTDSDGDAVPATVDIGSHIRFDDDGPSLVGTGATYDADEGDIVTSLAIGTSPNDGTHGNDGSYTGSKSGDIGAGPAVVSGSVAGAVDFGADGNGGFSFAAGAATTLAGLGLTSNDGKLSYALIDGGHTIVAYVNQTLFPGFPNSDYQPLVDRTIFTLTLDQTSGDFVFKLYDQLDHVSGGGHNTDLQGANGPVSGLDFGSLILATDGDGDSIAMTGKLTIDVTDDTPQISAAVNPIGYVTIDESAGVQGLPANDTTNSAVRGRFAALESAHGTSGTHDLGNDPDIAHSPNATSPAIGYAHSLGAVVVVTGLNIGADFPAQSLVYSLQVTAGTYSGVQTTDGYNIYLYEDVTTGLIVGRVGGNGAAHTDADPSGTIAFAIAIEQDGSIDVAQYLSLHHNNTSSNNESIALIDGAIQAVVTVKDHDGDPATAYASIGGHIVFNDDGPSAPTVSITGAEPKLLTFDGGLAGNYTGSEEGNGDGNVSPTIASVSFAGAFTVGNQHVYGADGPGQTVISYALHLKVSEGTDSHLTSGDQTIRLYEDNGVITGSTATSEGGITTANTIFTLSVDSSTGVVTLIQFHAVDQGAADSYDGGAYIDDVAKLAAGLVELTASAYTTDGDGDKSATASKAIDLGDNVAFGDDGPKIVAGKTVVGEVDEDALANHNTDSGQPGETHGATVAASVSGTLASLVNFGADGGAGIGAGFHLVPQGPAATSYKSGNATVNIVVTQDGLIGFTGNDYTIAGSQVFTLVVGATGAYTFTLLKPMDHDPLTGQPGDDTENTLTIDLSGYVTATDGDGDHVGLSAGIFTVTVRDDIPVVGARDGVPTETTVTGDETVTEHFTIKAGNVEARGLIGIMGDQGDHDLLLTATGGTVNTNSHDAAVGNQWIDSNSEILHLNFVTGLDNNNTFTGTDPHSSVKFTVTANGGKDSVVFIDATLGGAFVALSFAGVTAAHIHEVFAGGNPVGYVLDGVGSSTVITVSAAAVGGTFDIVDVSNYSGVNFVSNDGTHSYSGNKFHIGGIETTVTVQGTHTVTTPETFTVSEDESAGLNTTTDPNAADDHAAPDAITNADAYAAIYSANAVGYAQSAESVLVTHGNFNALFTGSPGADGLGGWSFAITDRDGNAFGGTTDSGLRTLNGTHILLTTDTATGALVGMAGTDVVFKVFVDSTGHVWIAQYQAIHNDIAGSDLAAYDDIAKVAADLHITATLTDADGDSVTKTSPVSLSVQFQDDGPVAMNDELNLADHADGKGNVITGLNEVAPATSADTVGTDGAHVSAISGANTGTFDNTDNLFHVAGAHGTLTIDADGNYTYTRNPSDFASGTDTFTYELKDGDGDTATATLTIDLPLLTTPLVAGDGFTGTVEEEEFGNNGVQLSSSGRTGNEDVTGDGDTETPVFHDNTTNVTTGTLTVTDGTGPYTFAFAGSGIEGTQATFGGEPATSNGKAVLFHIDSNNANTLIGYVENGPAGSGYDAAADRVVFTLQINTDASATDASSGYTFTLYDNLDAKGAQIDDNVEGTQALSLNGLVVVTDTIGGADHTVDVTGSVAVIDDIPIAIADTNTVAVNESFVTGNVLTDDAKGDHADAPGADGYASSGAIVGVSTNGSEVSDGTGLDSVGHTTGIAGQYGTLHLNADGSYEYDRTAGSAGGVDDVFTYTIKDGDGDLSHATLTIHIDDSRPNLLLANGSQTDVYEAGLMGGRNLDPTESAGSQYGIASATASGTFNVTSTDGVASVTINGVTVTGALTTVADSSTGAVPDDKGVLQAWYDSAAGQIHYTYTLTDNTLDTNGTTRNFDVVVTDNDGDVPSTATSLTINIVDDAPDAHADTDQAQSGETVTGNVETGVSTHGTGAADTAGADGIASITWSDAQQSGGVTTVLGSYGILTITNATGGYSYKAFANESGDDVFHYTITDGDGDTSPSTLTINVTNGQPQPAPGTGQVDESGLATGSHAGDPAHPITTTTATLNLGDTDNPVVTGAVGAGGPAGAADGATHILGTYGYLTIDATGKYSYTLTKAETNNPAGDNSTNIQSGMDVFTYTVQDAFENTNTSTITISIKDDVPTAHADTNAVNEGSSVNGNVLTDGTPDVLGADGGAVTGVATGSDTSHAVSGGLDNTPDNSGAGITGQYGTLHLHADGSYTYVPNAVTADVVDHFVYTITDGDGDTSTTTLDISVANSVPVVADGISALTVYEAALDTSKDIADLAAGVRTGTNPTSMGETDIDTNGLTFQATGQNITSIKFADPNNAFDSYATPEFTNLASGTPHWTLSADGRTLTLDFGGQTALILALSGASTIAAGSTDSVTVTATLVDRFAHLLPTSTLDVILSGVSVVAIDASGDQVAGTVSVNIVDDAPLFGTTGHTPDHGVIADQPGAKLFGDLNALFGADGPAASGALSLAGNTAPSNLLYDGTHKILYSVSGSTLTGYADMDNSGGHSANDVTVFTLSVDPTTDQYAFTLNAPFTQSTEIGGSGTAYGSGPALQDPLTVTATGVTTQIAIVSTTSGHEVWGSSGGWGVGNANFDNGERLRFDFTDGAINSPAPDSTFHGASPVFADFHFSKSGSVTYNVHYTDGSSTGNVTLNENGSLHLGTTGKVISYIDFTANAGLGKLDLVHVDQVYGVSQDLSFNVTATDGDGDPATGQIGIHIAGNSTLLGTTSEDVLSAGLNTTLTGGSGADHFLFTGSSATGTHITDFSGNAGQHDLIELLSSAFGSVSWNGDGTLNELIHQGSDAATATLGASQHFAYNSTTGQLYYDSDGGDTSGATRILLAILDNHAAVTATDIHKV